jgi:hypothetical protein
LKPLGLCILLASNVFAASPGDVVMTEVAWMGTTGSSANEWIALHNTTGSAVSLANWTLKAADNTPSITLSGSIGPYGYYLLERTDDNTIPGITADKLYTGALTDTGEPLVLRDGGDSRDDGAHGLSPLRHGGDGLAHVDRELRRRSRARHTEGGQREGRHVQ